MVVAESEILSEFEEFGIQLEANIVLKVKELCSKYSLTAEEFVETWVAYSTNKHFSLKPVEGDLSTFENEELKRIQRKKIHDPYKAPVAQSDNFIYDASTINDLIGDVENLLETYGSPEVQTVRKRQQTPDAFTNKKPSLFNNNNNASPVSPAHLSLKSQTPSEKYTSRTNSGDVLCEFGDNKNRIWKNDKATKNTGINYDEIMVIPTRYRYMYEKLYVSSRYLNLQIETMEDLYQKAYNIEEFSHVCLPSSDKVDVVGRICCDGNGKMNAQSLLLEGSRKTSSGMIAELDVSNLDTYSFFPGQIMAFSCTNPTGKKLVAAKVYDPIYPVFPQIVPLLSEPLLLNVVTGPYMTTDSLSYEPLEDFLKAVEANSPHACILLGPFVDAKNTEIEKNAFMPYDEIFAECMTIIGNCAERCGNIRMKTTEFIIVPSTRDVHHDCIFPTPPFEGSLRLKRLRNVHFVSDPSIISINGVMIGITTVDILFQLGKEEISFPLGMSDRLGRLASHLLSQQRFYPLFPPSEDLQISLEKCEMHCKLTSTPHILILPSDLSCFIKDVKGCCCINPQRLTRGNGPGTYARIHISPVNDKICSLISYITGQVIRI